MSQLLHDQWRAELPVRLAELLGLPSGAVRARPNKRSGSDAQAAPLVLEAGGRCFVVEFRADGSAAPVSMAVRAARASAGALGLRALPLVAAPFMGDVGNQICAQSGMSWMDLSGNGAIQAPGLRIQVTGNPNRFKRPGRPSTLFAPKSSRIAHWLLAHPQSAFTQRELARHVGMGEGFASRIVRGLEEEELVVRDPNGAVRVGDYDMLLDAWREAYNFSKHHIIRGHVAARSSDDILRTLGRCFDKAQVQHAVTGLAGAWLWTPFAGFRLVVFYVAGVPSAPTLLDAGFHPEQHGENVWLVVPNDAGVFLNARKRQGLACVDPVQLYLDLKNHPERSAEAAEHLRKELLTQEARV